jgi:hypothetical protein
MVMLPVPKEVTGEGREWEHGDADEAAWTILHYATNRRTKELRRHE